MPPRKTADPLGRLADELAAFRDEFRTWKSDVYGPGHMRVEEATEVERAGRRTDERELAIADDLKWAANAQAHADIICHLEKLNGFQNKVNTGLKIIGFCTPIGIAVWAIVTR